MANDFNVIEYLGTLIGYPIPRKAVERIASERGLLDVSGWTEISRKDRNLALADMLMVVFTSASNTGSQSCSHNGFSVSIGGTTITDKDNIYSLMMKLYENPDVEVWEALQNVGVCQWLE